MIGVNAIKNALFCDFVIIDEIGPMELISESFVSAVEETLESDKSILAVLHHSSRHPLARKIRKEFEVLTIDTKNRDEMPEKIFNLFASQLISRIINLPNPVARNILLKIESKKKFGKIFFKQFKFF